METLKQKISADYLSAFKSGDKIKKNLLGVVKSEITTTEKNTKVSDISDSDIIKILTKISKNLKETISLSNSEEAKIELSIIEDYLPVQMSEEHIRIEIFNIVSELGNISISDIEKVMSSFNSKFSGKAEGKIVSSIAKEFLSKKI